MGVIATIQASCRDCYKCVRSCPVKAIRIHDGHAEVVEERCIADGRCVMVCPQRAKKVESDIELVQEFFRSGQPVAASLAPSFASALEPATAGQVVSALKQLGFTYVAETAEGAVVVAQEHLRLINKGQTPLITSCCPAVVNLIEIYYPRLLPYLAQVVSPMVAHGKQLKERFGSTVKTVFIGPCIAKKNEVHTTEGLTAIDAVLSFQEIMEMIREKRIDFTVCPEKTFDGLDPAVARTFPIPGGLAKTAALSTDLLAKEIVSIDGLDEVIAFLDKFEEVKPSLKLIELLACRGGCIAGPGMTSKCSIFSRRSRVLNYAAPENKPNAALEGAPVKSGLSQTYKTRSQATPEPTEQQIAAILARTGKFKPEDELNCGACGYNSCREKALAVVAGMAEVNMCIPYMRAKAESRANLIFKVSPNAIFVIDSDLRILELNPAAAAKFQCTQEKMAGEDLGVLMDPKYFVEVLHTKELVTGEVSFPAYGIITWQAICYVEAEDVLIGIFADITSERKQRDKLARVTDETLQNAQEVINKQMKVAQEIAGLLGETTAETKVLLTKIMKLIQNEEGKAE